MLIQHFKYVTPSLPTVKQATAALITTAAVLCAPLGAQASPGYDSIVTKEYSAKFKRAMFQSEDGLQQVYSVLLEKAETACKFGTALGNDGERLTREECVDDMLKQFVSNADVPALTALYENEVKSAG